MSTGLEHTIDAPVPRSISIAKWPRPPVEPKLSTIWWCCRYWHFLQQYSNEQFRCKNCQKVGHKEPFKDIIRRLSGKGNTTINPNQRTPDQVVSRLPFGWIPRKVESMWIYWPTGIELVLNYAQLRVASVTIANKLWKSLGSPRLRPFSLIHNQCQRCILQTDREPRLYVTCRATNIITMI